MPLMSPAQRRARMAEVFDSVADSYDNVGVDWFQPIAQELVRLVAPRPGERAIDVGCGRGAALFELAREVGPTGVATGFDLSPRMVQLTGLEARARGLSNVDLYVMDAGSPDGTLSGYQVLVSSFVLFFLPAPLGALRAWRGLLAPGGRMGISTFTDSHSGWLDSIFRPYLPDTGYVAESPFATDAGVEELAAEAGFTDVRTVGWELDVVFADVEQWYDWSWSHGQRATWERIPEQDRPLVKAAAGAHLERSRRPDGTLALTQRIRFTLATNPG